jgi:hypothetical protein
VEILPQQSEFPKLVRDIFPDVRDRSIRTHNYLVLHVLLVISLLGDLCVGFSFSAFMIQQPAIFPLVAGYNPAASASAGASKSSCRISLSLASSSYEMPRRFMVLR